MIYKTVMIKNVDRQCAGNLMINFFLKVFYKFQELNSSGRSLNFGNFMAPANQLINYHDRNRGITFVFTLTLFRK